MSGPDLTWRSCCLAVQTVQMSFFGVGAPEALLVGVVALVVFGPKGLADVSLKQRLGGPGVHSHMRRVHRCSAAAHAWGHGPHAHALDQMHACTHAPHAACFMHATHTHADGVHTYMHLRIIRHIHIQVRPLTSSL